LGAGIGQAAAQIEKGDITIELETIASGLTSPIYLTNAGDGSGRLFVVDQAGQIRIIDDGVLLETPFLDLSGIIVALNPGFDERGLLGLAFHPDYAENGRFFVRYSAPREGAETDPCFGTARGCHEEILAEYGVSKNPNVADPTGTILFRVDEPEFNHNAGTVAFGPDGFLYFSLGDGGGANDGLHLPELPHGPIGNGQNIETALGSVLRIDVDAKGNGLYGIPSDNPFVGTNGLDEIYAYGFRNPYRFSFDDGPGGTGRLLLGDVGQDVYEELDDVVLGGNYGWVIREAAHCFDPFNPKVEPKACQTEGLIDPIAEYTQAEGGLSIIGGFVYRGTVSPTLVGTYVFGDYSGQFASPLGRLYYIESITNGMETIQEFRIGLDDEPFGRFLKGFGEGEDGEIYVLGSSIGAPTGTSGVVQHLRVLDTCQSTAACPETDVNCDNITDGGDIAVVRRTDNWLLSTSDAGDPRADVNGDGVIDGSDVAAIRNTACFLVSAAEPLPDCNIDMESLCPDDNAPLCGAAFDGGESCQVIGVGACYSSGAFSYRVRSGEPLTITLDGDLNSLDVFFSGHQASTGTMTFFDADDQEVDSPLASLGDCAVSMPDMLFVEFSRPVRRIEVECTGSGSVWIDDFHVNPK
jgi:glucose/arabinose dehydrogenase